MGGYGKSKDSQQRGGYQGYGMGMQRFGQQNGQFQ